MKTILITGGAGYIGSHTVVECMEAGFEVVVVDDLSNSSKSALSRVEKITGKKVVFYQGDVCDSIFLSSVFDAHHIDSVIHFAGVKAVGESVNDPIFYYKVNVSGTLTLCDVMRRYNIYKLIFSSSATVYGACESSPLHENANTTEQTNPYGRSKSIVENFLKDLVLSDSKWSIAILRYFNPVGAHFSGLIGEDPRGRPGNIFPIISQVAIGRLNEILVYGSDYATKDGTGVRDYIHVSDLASGHLAALVSVDNQNGINTWNLGTGIPYSVLDLINAFSKITGRSIPFAFSDRRPGDVAECWSDPRKAMLELGWSARLDLQRMVEDTWRWQLANPNGYKEVE